MFTETLLSNERRDTRGAVIDILSSMKFGSDIHRLIREGFTDTDSLEIA
jgi:hypothetical protein